jgi:branched-chain amino acid transport system permease protein
VYWINTIIQGALVGGLYALFATGLSLMFGVMRIINIAHGDFIILAAYFAIVVTETLGVDPLVAVVFVAPLMFGLGYALQRGLLNLTLGGDILRPLLVTFGLSVVVQNLLLEGFSAASRRLQVPWLETASVRIGEHLAMGVMPAVVFTVAVITIAALEALLYWTDLGRAFRATSDDSDMARLYGVNNRHVYAMATAIALAVIDSRNFVWHSYDFRPDHWAREAALRF